MASTAPPRNKGERGPVRSGGITHVDLVCRHHVGSLCMHVVRHGNETTGLVTATYVETTLAAQGFQAQAMDVEDVEDHPLCSRLATLLVAPLFTGCYK